MISAVVLTKNEEKNLPYCLESLKWCGEIIVIDDYSEDKTVQIAEKFGAKVYKHKLKDNFAVQRNFGLDKALGEWVLFVDADEVVTPALRGEITQLLSKSVTQKGLYIKRRDIIWGKELKYGETGNARLLRLAKKGAGDWKRAVHEIWNVTGSTGELESPLIHYPHQTIKEFIQDIDRYSTLHAQELAKEGKRSNIFKIMLWPKFKFWQNYLFRLGFLDGGPGFVVTMMMCFHSYLAWSKLWLAQNKGDRT